MSRDYDSIRSLVERQATDAGTSVYLLAARDDRRLTYADLVERVEGWRHVLRTHDVREGSRVGLVIGDPIDFAVALLAVLCDGSWAAPVDPTVVDAGDERFRRRVSNLRLDAVISDRVAAANSLMTWIRVTDGERAEPGRRAAAPDRTGGIILSSSGTTGTPKVIALTDDNLMYAARLIAEHNLLTPDERGFNPLPLWHINAEVVGLLATLVAGASLVLDDRFHRTGFWALIDRFEVTWANAVPAIISRISVVDGGESVPPRLRFVRSASAPLSPVLMTTFQTNTGVAIVESYGMTEAASQICANPVDGVRKIGSVGPPIGVELRVRPLDDAQALEPHDHDATTVGLIEIRGPSVVTHYDASGYEDRFDSEAWLTTGDLGYVDDDGYVFLVGRSDDIINRGGEKMFPREIEDVVLALTDVVAAAVLGIPDDVFGQVPVLYVQFAASVQSSPTALEEHVRQLCDELTTHFSRARRPVRVIVVTEFPAHATGKIQKKSLAGHTEAIVLQRDVR